MKAEVGTEKERPPLFQPTVIKVTIESEADFKALESVAVGVPHCALKNHITVDNSFRALRLLEDMYYAISGEERQ